MLHHVDKPVPAPSHGTSKCPLCGKLYSYSNHTILPIFLMTTCIPCRSHEEIEEKEEVVQETQEEVPQIP